MLQLDVKFYIRNKVARKKYSIKILYSLHRVIIGPQKWAGEFRERGHLFLLPRFET